MPIPRVALRAREFQSRVEVADGVRLAGMGSVARRAKLAAPAGQTIGFRRLSVCRAAAEVDRPRKAMACPTSHGFADVEIRFY
jgi:hypothetical protein